MWQLARLVGPFAALSIVFAAVGLLNRLSWPRGATESGDSNIILCRPAVGWAFMISLLSVGMLAGSIFFANQGIRMVGTSRGAVLLCFAIVGVVEVSYFILGLLMYRVILRPDSITLTGIFIDKTLTRAEIAGRRFFARGGARYVRLLPKDGVSKPSIKIAFWYDHDADIQRWVADILDISWSGQHPAVGR